MCLLIYFLWSVILLSHEGQCDLTWDRVYGLLSAKLDKIILDQDVIKQEMKDLMTSMTATNQKMTSLEKRLDEQASISQQMVAVRERLDNMDSHVKDVAAAEVGQRTNLLRRGLEQEKAATQARFEKTIHNTIDLSERVKLLDNKHDIIKSRVDTFERTQLDLQSNTSAIAAQVETTRGQISRLQHVTVTCPVGYSANGNICYKYHKACYTWEKASEACVTAGGFLYKIADDESYQLINSLVDGNGLCDHGVWVGSRREADGSLKWRDNTLTDLNKFWSGGQPDGPNNGESCVEIRNAFGNLMNDRQCWIEKGFVCQAHPQGCSCRRGGCLYNEVEYKFGQCSNGISCCRVYSG